MKNQRIASKLGNIDDFGAYPRRVDYAGADLKDINYDEKYKSEVKELETRYDSLGNDCTFRVVNDYVNGKSFCCDNNEVEIFNRPDTESGNSEDAGIFFYHPDHLGSTAMVTDADGRITQNVVYIPFGEVFVEQRDGNWNTPYLFNAKELDEETGLYYFGARYLDPTGAQWLSVDPLFEKYPDFSPYNYCAGNPVRLVDVDGRRIQLEGEESVVNEGFDQLNNSTSLDLTLSNGVVNASGTPKTEADKVLLEAINSDVVVNLSITSSKDNNGKYFIGGCSNGSKVNDGVVIASQTINPQMTSMIDETMGQLKGLTFMHETLEAYFMGRDHPGSESPTFDPNTTAYKKLYRFT